MKFLHIIHHVQEKLEGNIEKTHSYVGILDEGIGTELSSAEYDIHNYVGI